MRTLQGIPTFILFIFIVKRLQVLPSVRNYRNDE